MYGALDEPLTLPRSLFSLTTTIPREVFDAATWPDGTGAEAPLLLLLEHAPRASAESARAARALRTCGLLLRGRGSLDRWARLVLAAGGRTRSERDQADAHEPERRA